jgi:hypothetical protein
MAGPIMMEYLTSLIRDADDTCINSQVDVRCIVPKKYFEMRERDSHKVILDYLKTNVLDKMNLSKITKAVWTIETIVVGKPNKQSIEYIYFRHDAHIKVMSAKMRYVESFHLPNLTDQQRKEYFESSQKVMKKFGVVLNLQEVQDIIEDIEQDIADDEDEISFWFMRGK